jgi:hypothetical protein
VKHKIKAVDRLFGHTKLQENVTIFYKVILNKIIGSNIQPIIIVDWSGLTPCGNYHFIRAAVPIGGRALSILEIAYDLKKYTSPKTHEFFLKKLKALLPKNCKPIIITDAGFCNPWFKFVTSLGWDYIGRIRNSTMCSLTNRREWRPIKQLYLQATNKAKYLGQYNLAKHNVIDTHLFIFKGKRKNRIKRNLIGLKVRCSSSLKHQRRESEPLLIASSITGNATKIIKMYQKRMQIEQGFRDIKNERNGFSLRQNRSMSIGRLTIALLIAAIAMLILWLLGIVAKMKNIHRQYQANTVRSSNVLSNFVIGWQLLEENKIRISPAELDRAVSLISEGQFA